MAMAMIDVCRSYKQQLLDFAKKWECRDSMYSYPLNPSPYGNILDKVAAFDGLVVEFIENMNDAQNAVGVDMIRVLTKTSERLKDCCNSFIDRFEDLLYDWLNDGGHFSRGDSDSEEEEDVRDILERDGDVVYNYWDNNRYDLDLDLDGFYLEVLDSLDLELEVDCDIIAEDDDDDVSHASIDAHAQLCPGFKEFWHGFVNDCRSTANDGVYWSSFKGSEYKDYVEKVDICVAAIIIQRRWRSVAANPSHPIGYRVIDRMFAALGRV